MRGADLGASSQGARLVVWVRPHSARQTSKAPTPEPAELVALHSSLDSTFACNRTLRRSAAVLGWTHDASCGPAPAGSVTSHT